jgi:hypothetical protein
MSRGGEKEDFFLLFLDRETERKEERKRDYFLGTQFLGELILRNPSQDP